jgi:hypothetical protein
MNERIKDLVEQATRKYDRLGIEIPFAQPDLAKFAELIINECARIARATPCPYTDPEQIKMFGHTWDMASIEAGRNIVEQLGDK